MHCEQGRRSICHTDLPPAFLPRFETLGMKHIVQSMSSTPSLAISSMMESQSKSGSTSSTNLVFGKLIKRHERTTRSYESTPLSSKQRIRNKGGQNHVVNTRLKDEGYANTSTVSPKPEVNIAPVPRWYGLVKTLTSVTFSSDPLS